MSIKITSKEKKILEKLISTYSKLYSDLEQLELKIEEASKQHNLLKSEYDKVNSLLLSTRNEEYQFFLQMKEKYPGITNLKELI